MELGSSELKSASQVGFAFMILYGFHDRASFKQGELGYSS